LNKPSAIRATDAGCGIGSADPEADLNSSDMEENTVTLAAMRRKALRLMLKGLVDEYLALITRTVPRKVKAQA
jgi:hypothetical protein